MERAKEWNVRTSAFSASGSAGRDAGAHLVGGAAREREGEDALRAHVLVGHQVRDPLDQHAGLARAWPGEHEEGPSGVLDGLELIVVEVWGS